MSILLLICIVIISRLLLKKLPSIASFFYDRRRYTMMHDSVIRESLLDIRNSIYKNHDRSLEEDTILESYTKIQQSQLNVQSARKEIEQKDIIKKAIHDELNIE